MRPKGTHRQEGVFDLLPQNEVPWKGSGSRGEIEKEGGQWGWGWGRDGGLGRTPAVPGYVAVSVACGGSPVFCLVLCLKNLGFKKPMSLGSLSLVSIYYVSGLVPHPGDTAVNRTDPVLIYGADIPEERAWQFDYKS